MTKNNLIPNNDFRIIIRLSNLSHPAKQTKNSKKQLAISQRNNRFDRQLSFPMIEVQPVDLPRLDKRTAAMEEQKSDIQKFYSGTSIFITGASGFLGKLLLEKLLRSCDDIKRIYILLRSKKGKNSHDRYYDFFNEPLFQGLVSKQPDIVNKVSMIVGDCVQPNLGLSESDRALLTSEVDCVFHCAATVRFDQHLTTATFINVRAVRDLIDIAKEMKQLKSFIHVSTAYSYCLRRDIDEKFYKPLVTAEKIIKIAEEINENTVHNMTSTLIGGWPNTYTFTKSIAEDLVRENGAELPIAVFRPSIVISTAREPIPGWIDNVYGPTGVVVAAALGILRTLLADKKKKADLVPADYVINAIISAGWDVGIKQFDENFNRKESTGVPEIYNYVATPENPMNWETYMARAAKAGLSIPTIKSIWFYLLFLQNNRLVNSIYGFFLHTIPAQITDFLLFFMGKKPILLDAYKKIDKFTDVISFFSLKEWNFSNINTRSLWQRLSPRDQDLFYFSMSKLDWEEFFGPYMQGCRVYLVKDAVETIPAARRWYRKLQMVHYAVVGVVVGGCCWGVATAVRALCFGY